MRPIRNLFHFSRRLLIRTLIIASIGFGLFMLLASYAGLRQVTAICFILIAYGLQGSYFPSIRVNAIDLAPNYAGTLISITNGLGAITGFIGPYVAGLLTPHVNAKMFVETWTLFMRMYQF